MQIIQQNLSFCQSRSEKPLLLKSRILKIRRGFSSIFEDRKRLFGSVFVSKPASPRSRPVGYPRQMLCFVPLWGPNGAMSDFDDFFDFLHPFSLFSDFGVSGTNVSLAWEKRTSVKNLHRKWHFSLSGLLGPLLENYAFGIRNTHIRCSEPFFFTFLLMSFLTEIMSFTSAGIRFLKTTPQNCWKSDVEITNRVLR